MLLSNWRFAHRNTLAIPLGNPESVTDEAKDADRISIDYQVNYFIVISALALNAKSLCNVIATIVDNRYPVDMHEIHRACKVGDLGLVMGLIEEDAKLVNLRDSKR